MECLLGGGFCVFVYKFAFFGQTLAIAECFGVLLRRFWRVVFAL